MTALCQTRLMAEIRVAQLSDTHFLEDGEEAEGGAAYDTDAAFEAVYDSMRDLEDDLDLVVVTGDVADHGRAGQYRKAAEAFNRFAVPVNACPGNHDFVTPFSAGIGRLGVSTSRVIEIGDWAFVFVDSSAGVMSPDSSGLTVDPPGETRLHNNGNLGAAEAAWVRQICESVTVPHVFIWLHHPPGPPLPLCYDEDYAAEWRAVVPDLPNLRGMAGGHTHVPDHYEFEGVPVFVAGSFKNSFSMEPQQWLPPAYRTYVFSDDGTVTSENHFAADNDELWPRRPFGRTLKSLFMGEINYDQLREIVAQRQAAD